VLVEPFNGVFPFDHGHHDVVMTRTQAAIHNHLVALLDAGADHGITFDREHVGRRLSTHEVVVQIQAIFGIIGCWRRKTGRQPMLEQLEFERIRYTLESLGGLAQAEGDGFSGCHRYCI
jgi:hypothetical protein